MIEPRVCGYCGVRPTIGDVTGLAVCGACHWAVRTEVEAGFAKLRTYLRHWDEFRAWCDTESARAEPTAAEGASPAGRAD